MTSRLVEMCFDAADPVGLAKFWSEALAWSISDEPQDDGEAALVASDGTGFELLFLPASSAKVEKNRLHFDLSTTSLDDQQRTVERLLALGATPVDIGQDPDDGHVVLADPEGNEFCVLEPGNSFVSATSRLGSITCDGSPEVGHFWSEALGWPLVWDQDDETAIRAPDGTGPFVTWGPPARPKVGKNRLHLDIAATSDSDQQSEVDRLVALGATPIDIGQGDVSWVVLADPDGNEFCILSGD